VKVYVVHAPGADEHMVAQAIGHLEAKSVEAVEMHRDAPADLKGADLILTLGGDGTFLAGARLAAPKGIPVLGVNLGRLGFLTELEHDQLEEGFQRYLAKDFRIEERNMLQVTVSRAGKTVAPPSVSTRSWSIIPARRASSASRSTSAGSGSG
jgi:NAD kinase